MKRAWAKLRRWSVPILLAVLVAGLTVPWTFWVLSSAYNRDVNESVRMLGRRIGVQLGGTGPGATPPKEVRDALAAELLSDDRVQAVCVFDLTRPVDQQRLELARFAGTPLPADARSIDGLLHQDPNSLRVKLEWTFDLARLRDEVSRGFGRPVNDAELRELLQRAGVGQNLIRGYLYLDLSQAKLREHFWELNGPVMKRIVGLTAIVIILVSVGGFVAYTAWERSAAQRHRAELAREGAVAERGLTAAVLAHEIRNPLGALRFQLHSLKKNAADSKRVEDTCHLIDSELARIKQLVDDYLAHERATTMRAAPVELATAIETLHTIMHEQLRSTATELEVTANDQRIVVTCDPHALRQVLMNLVINAQQAMGRGGTITIATGVEEGFGTIDVADTGPGIPPEMRDRLFKPFQSSKREGSGIGLALVKRFVDNFGGGVDVRSEPGKGARFRLRLPLTAGAQGQSPKGESK